MRHHLNKKCCSISKCVVHSQILRHELGWNNASEHYFPSTVNMDESVSLCDDLSLFSVFMCVQVPLFSFFMCVQVPLFCVFLWV